MGWRVKIEEGIVDELARNGVRALTVISLYPPTQEFTVATFMDIAREHEIEALLVVDIREAWSAYSLDRGTSSYSPRVKIQTRIYDLSNSEIVWMADSQSKGNNVLNFTLVNANFELLRDSYTQRLVQELTAQGLLVKTFTPPPRPNNESE